MKKDELLDLAARSPDPEITDADRALLEAITGGNFDFRPKAKKERLAMIAAFRVEAAANAQAIAALPELIDALSGMVTAYGNELASCPYTARARALLARLDA